MNLTPLHLHLLLNHLPIVGLAIATLGLFPAILTRSHMAQIISLALILLTSAMAWPVYVTGEKAYKEIHTQVDDDGADWLDTHWDRAEKNIWFFAIPASLALLGIFVPRRFSKISAFILWATFFSAAGCLGVAAWIADAGGKIRHTEIRPEIPET